jgi:hypothetical protein
MTVQRDSRKFIGLLLGLIVGLIAGIVVGSVLEGADWRRECIRRGVARYNQTTAEWHWIDPASSNVVETGGE